jgi:osmotically-inducible protein OsmY
MRPHPFRQALAASLLAAAGLACTAQTQSGDQSPAPSGEPPASTAAETAEEAKDKVVAGAEKAGEALKDAAQAVQEKAGPTARAVGEDVKTYGKAAGDVLDAKKQALDVKAALMADDEIDASSIDVDAHSETNTITLRGMVPTAAHKAAAERIARDKAKGYKVQNQLTVAAAR